MNETPANESGDAADDEAAAASWSPPAWVRDVAAAATALRDLVAAQIGLLGAELRLARSAARSALVALAVALVLLLAVGLTALALLAAALEQWLGSWPAALGILVLIQVLLLAITLWWFRRCLHWMTLPASRAEWRSLVERVRSPHDEEQEHEPASSTR